MPSSRTSTDCSKLAAELAKLSIKYGQSTRSLKAAIKAVQNDFPSIKESEIVDAISMHSSETGNSALDMIVKRQRLRQLKTRTASQQKEIDQLTKRINKLGGASKQELQAVRRIDTLNTELREKRIEAEKLVMDARPKTKAGRVAKAIALPFRTARLIMTIGDLPMLGQASKVALSNPRIAAMQLGKTFRAMLRPGVAEEVMESLRARPNGYIYDRFNMLASPGGPTSKREDYFVESLIDKIPGLKGIKDRLEDGYSTYMNLVRADYYDYLADKLARNGKPTLDEAKAIANFVNVWTGRGSLGALERNVSLLNDLMFAPRYFAAKWQAATFQPIWKSSGQARTLIAKEYAKTILGLSAMLSLASYAGAKVGTDPLSTDFGKVRIGDTRLDFMGGNIAPLVFMLRTIMGKKTTGEGKTIKIRGKDAAYGQEWYTELARQVRYAASPLAGTTINLLTGKNAIGQDVTVGSQIKELTVPFFLNDSYKAMKEFGPVPGTAILILAFLGTRVNVHEKQDQRR